MDCQYHSRPFGDGGCEVVAYQVRASFVCLFETYQTTLFDLQLGTYLLLLAGTNGPINKAGTNGPMNKVGKQVPAKATRLLKSHLVTSYLIGNQKRKMRRHR
jgi:hypothetical protein